MYIIKENVNVDEVVKELIKYRDNNKSAIRRKCVSDCISRILNVAITDIK